MRGVLQVLLQFRRDERGAMAADLAKAGIAIAFLSVIAANIMSNRIDSGEKSTLASISGEAAKGRAVDNRAVDLASTGSLARAANMTRFDPCELPPKR